MLEISRADVLGDQLMNYSPEERFIKLPVPPYLELLGIEAIPSQIGIINAINSTQRNQSTKVRNEICSETTIRGLPKL